MPNKMMNPKVTIWWVPESAGWDPQNPSAALLTDARNISCAIDTGYKLGPTDSKTSNRKSICDAANVETYISYNYEGSLTFFRDADLAENASAYARAFAFFKDGTQNGLNKGHLVRRVGYKSTVAAAVGQEVESFYFAADNPQDQVGDQEEITYTVPFKQQGSMALFVPLAA